jgi:uncharacterized MAPEG superfamily protein
MQSEIGILAYFGLLIIVTIAAQAVFAVAQLGLGYLVGPRDAGKKLSGAGARLERAANNNLQAFAYFAPAALLVGIEGTGSDFTLLAAQIFLIARLAYVPAYVSGIPLLRTAIWSVGLGASLYIYAVALT